MESEWRHELDEILDSIDENVNKTLKPVVELDGKDMFKACLDNSTNLLLLTSWCTWLDKKSYVIHDINGVFKSNLKVIEGHQSNNLALWKVDNSPTTCISQYYC
ncbi:hypothetical protein SUGI_0489640 [Cryptomeria japonica]|nr:hypothetical protein SUGI_0489640 [Cryptomeria japonica]